MRKVICNRRDFLCLVESPTVELFKITTLMVWWLQFKVTFTRLIFPKPVSSQQWGRKYLNGSVCSMQICSPDSVSTERETLGPYESVVICKDNKTAYGNAME